MWTKYVFFDAGNIGLFKITANASNINYRLVVHNGADKKDYYYAIHYKNVVCNTWQIQVCFLRYFSLSFSQFILLGTLCLGIAFFHHLRLLRCGFMLSIIKMLYVILGILMVGGIPIHSISALIQQCRNQPFRSMEL